MMNFELIYHIFDSCISKMLIVVKVNQSNIMNQNLDSIKVILNKWTTFENVKLTNIKNNNILELNLIDCIRFATQKYY